MFEVKIANSLIQTMCPSLDNYSKFEGRADQGGIAPAFQPVIDAYVAAQKARLNLLDAYFMRDKTVSLDEIDRYVKASSKFNTEAWKWAELPLSDELTKRIKASPMTFKAIGERIRIEEARIKHAIQNGEEQLLDDFQSICRDYVWMMFELAAILNASGEEILAQCLSAATPTTN